MATVHRSLERVLGKADLLLALRDVLLEDVKQLITELNISLKMWPGYRGPRVGRGSAEKGVGREGRVMYTREVLHEDVAFERILWGELEIVKGRLCHFGRWQEGRPFTTCSSSWLRAVAWFPGADARILLTSQELWTQKPTPNEQPAKHAVGPWERFSTANQKWLMST